jgi:hypothetical protein
MCLYESFWFNAILAPLHTQYIHHELNMLLVHVKSMVTFQWESYWTFVIHSIYLKYCIKKKTKRKSILSCNPEKKTEGSLWAFQEPLACQNLEIQCKPKKSEQGVIEDYYYMSTMNENMNWMKLTYMLSIISLNLWIPFCTSTLPQFLNSLF